MEKIILEEKQGNPTFKVSLNNNSKKLYLESYGCQMNFSDSEIVAAILTEDNYVSTNNIEEADIILVNTCSIREKAEESNSYYFYFSTNYLSTSQPNNLMGAIDGRYASGKVSKETYEKYDIGEN